MAQTRNEMKDIIADTMIRISAKKEVDKITVTELAELCGISRQAFYYYYSDILNVIEWTIERQNIAISEKIDRLPDNKEAGKIFLEELLCHFPEISLIRKSRLCNYWVDIFLKDMKNMIMKITDKEDNFKIDFAACGLTMYVMEHCDDLAYDREKFIRDMEKVIQMI